MQYFNDKLAGFSFTGKPALLILTVSNYSINKIMTLFPLVKLIEINQAAPTHVKLSHGRDATLSMATFAERVPKQQNKVPELHLTTSNLG